MSGKSDTDTIAGHFSLQLLLQVQKTLMYSSLRASPLSKKTSIKLLFKEVSSNSRWETSLNAIVRASSKARLDALTSVNQSQTWQSSYSFCIFCRTNMMHDLLSWQFAWLTSLEMVHSAPGAKSTIFSLHRPFPYACLLG